MTTRGNLTLSRNGSVAVIERGGETLKGSFTLGFRCASRGTRDSEVRRPKWERFRSTRLARGSTGGTGDPCGRTPPPLIRVSPGSDGEE